MTTTTFEPDSTNPGADEGNTSSGKLERGNFSLCEIDDTFIRCLNWGPTDDRPRDVSMEIVPIHVNSNGQIGQISPVGSYPLKWRFEDGLLKAVGENALCLGPSKNITSLKADSSDPYKLELQDCPSSVGGLVSATPGMDEWILPSDPGRHMRFQMDDKRRMKSLAPVLSDGKDFVVDHPFCITVIPEKDTERRNLYLVPCLENDADAEESLVNVNPAITLEQQIFKKIWTLSTYDSYMTAWKDLHDENTIHLAYQIGKKGVPKHENKFDLHGFAIVMKQNGEHVFQESHRSRPHYYYFMDEFKLAINLPEDEVVGILPLTTDHFHGLSGEVELNLVHRSNFNNVLASTIVGVPQQPGTKMWPVFVASTIAFTLAVILSASLLWFVLTRRRLLSSEKTASKKDPKVFEAVLVADKVPKETNGSADV